ncbi:MAG TPA: oligosaccharide flippase family protein [Blastocatellia bacterium]|nr:oligosaccharide flippase family protein [Blastocatellia bacterium]
MAESAARIISPGVSLRARLQSSVFWNLIANVFGQGSTLLINVIVANLLGRQLFGDYSMIQSTLVTLTLLAPLATGFIATKYVAELRAADKARAGRVMGLCWIVSATTGLLAAMALLTFASRLAAGWLHAPHLTAALMITAGAVLFTVQNAAQQGALSGLESYRALAMARIASSSVALLMCSLLAWKGGVNGAVTGLALSAFAQWLVFRFYLRAETAAWGISISYRDVWKERSILGTFAIPAALSGLSAMSAIWLTGSLLFRHPQGQTEMAIFTAANNLRTAVLFVPIIINYVGTSLINNQRGTGNLSRYRRMFLANLAMTTAAVVAGSVTLMLIGPSLLRVFGRDFSEGSLALFFLLLAAIPEVISMGVSQLVQSQGRMWTFLLAAVVPRDVMLIVMAQRLIPGAGAVGLAKGYAVAMSLGLACNLVIALAVRRQTAAA